MSTDDLEEDELQRTPSWSSSAMSGDLEDSESPKSLGGESAELENETGQEAVATQSSTPDQMSKPLFRRTPGASPILGRP